MDNHQSASHLSVCSSEKAAVRGLPGRRGFTVLTPNFRITWALRDYPLISNLSMYWYAVWLNRDTDGWLPVQAEDLNETDSGQACSWQNISVRAGGYVTTSVIATFGDVDTNRLVPNLLLPTQTPLYSQTEVNVSDFLKATATLVGSIFIW
jgi:hypothetical protein